MSEILDRYKDHKPTPFDRHLGICSDDGGREEWYIAPVSVNRDSGALERSNFASFLAGLGGESETVEVHRFGHWGPGWYEIILIDPSDGAAVEEAEAMACALADYPVLDEEDFCREEAEEADETWRFAYDEAERLDYIRKHRAQFRFESWADLRAQVRGDYFRGWASELLQP